MLIIFIAHESLVAMEQNQSQASTKQGDTTKTKKKRTRHKKKNKKTAPTPVAPSTSQCTAQSIEAHQAAKPEIAQVIQTSQTELDQLAEQYKAGISIKGISGLTKINLTKKTLTHVFGKQFKSKSGDVYLEGYHHETSDPFFFSIQGLGDGTEEGFIAFDRSHIPVYKTFFSSLLTKQQIIEMLIKSLNNIQKQEICENDINRWCIDGIASNGVSIKTIIDKKTGEVITFYPLSKKSKDEISSENKRLKLLFKKHFHQRKDKPNRPPLTETEVHDLLQQFGNEIPFKMIISAQNILIPTSKIESMQQRAPLIVKLALTSLRFTPQSLSHAFSKTNDLNFPPYLSRAEILTQVKQALENISQNQNGIKISGYKDTDEVLKLKGISNATKSIDAFVFLIKINKRDGTIEDFYPLFY